MTDVLSIAHPQNCPPYGNSRVGICEGNLSGKCHKPIQQRFLKKSVLLTSWKDAHYQGCYGKWQIK